MKVLQINSVCGFGSTGKIATDLHDVLESNGYESKIAYARFGLNRINEANTIKIGNDFDVKFHVLMTRITDKTGFYSARATKKLIKQIEEYNPDIIHLHNIHGYYINIEILFKYLVKANKPVVWTLHDCWSFTGHCSYFDIAACDKWKTACHNCPQKKEYPKSSIFDNSKNNFRRKKQLFTSIKNMTIITPSKWLADLAKVSYLGKYPVQVINNGIDLSVFKPIISDFREKNNLSDKKIVLGVASMWEERKGLNDFIRLSKILNDDYKIVLVGLNAQQIESLPNNILGITRTNNVDELIGIYSTADVFVNPTYEDNFPTTNIESLACGTPVITYNTGGSPESLDDSCGVVVEKGGIQQLKIEIVRMIKLKKELRTSCLERSKCFNKTDKYEEYIRVFKEKI